MRTSGSRSGEQRTSIRLVVTVCLPDPEDRGVLDEMHGVEALVWDGQCAPPGGIDRTDFLVLRHGAPYAEMIAVMPRLRIVQVTSAGIEYLRGLIPAGVTLCNGSGIHGGPVAEWILAGVLACVRELPGFLRAQERREWEPHGTGELAGKRALVVGAGDLGTQAARLLRAFQVDTVMVGRSARAGVHASEELPALLPAAEIVVLVVPSTDETRQMVDASFLSRMRDGALLVNAARGEVVVTEALLAELESHRLHAVLDVTDPEPLPPDHRLWRAPNLLLTPHVAGAVSGHRARRHAFLREQIGRHLRGEPLLNVVNGAY